MTIVETSPTEGLRWSACAGNPAPAATARDQKEPEDAALARTIAEHIHCGEPMKVVTAGNLPITAPLMILNSETVPPAPLETRIRTYRCNCGFTLDAPTGA